MFTTGAAVSFNLAPGGFRGSWRRRAAVTLDRAARLPSYALVLIVAMAVVLTVTLDVVTAQRTGAEQSETSVG